MASPDAPEHTRRVLFLAALAVFVTGSGLALQGRLAAALGRHIGVVPAIAISNTSGLLPLAVVVILSASRRVGLRRLIASRPPLWQWLAGLCGTIVSITIASVIPVIGVALIGVVMTATQAICSLAVDRAGIGSTGVMLLSRKRVAGVGLALVAVAIAGLGRGGHLTLFLLLLLVAVGVIGTLPSAANGHLTLRSGSPIVTAFVNFASGAVVIDSLFVLSGLIVGWPTDWPSNAGLYVSGVPSAIFVVASAAALRPLGVLGVTLATVAGNLCGALVLDVLAPATGSAVPVTTIVATALTLSAVVVTTYTRAARVLP